MNSNVLVSYFGWPQSPSAARTTIIPLVCLLHAVLRLLFTIIFHPVWVTALVLEVPVTWLGIILFL